MKYMTATVKALSDDGPGSFEAVASAPTIDRDGELILTGAFSPLPASLPIHVDHRMSTDGIVGSGQPFYSGDRLMVRGTFASTARAQEVRQLVKEGHLSHMSVGFMGAARKDVDGVPTITKGELLEISFVTVSSNREALVLAAKAHPNDMTLDEVRRFIKQTTLDLARADLRDARRVLVRTAIQDAGNVLRRTT